MPDNPIESLSSQDWYLTPLGEYVCQQEKPLFDEKVVDIFGFHAVQIGMTHIDLLAHSRISHNIKVDGEAANLYCDSTQQPFSANSIDLLLLPHGLDVSINPQQTLREAERVLVAEGYVILTGFNPLSLWGVVRLIKNRRHLPWRASFFSVLRIKDWLALLGFEVIQLQMLAYAPPMMSHQWLNRFAWLERSLKKCLPMIGGAYFIVAQKKVMGMRLIKPQWQKSKFKAHLISTPTQKDVSAPKTSHSKKD